MRAASSVRVLAVLAGVRILTVGIYSTPNADQFVLLAQHPFGPVALEADQYYLTTSPIGPLLAHIVHAQTIQTYALLHLVILACGMAALVAWVDRSVGRLAATSLVVLLFASPLSNILLTWLGQPDVFLVVAGTAIAVAATNRALTVRWIVAVAGGFVMGLASAETALLGLIAFALVAWTTSRRARVPLIAALIGLAAGRLGVSLFHHVSAAPFESRSAAAAQIFGYGTIARRALYNFPAFLYSTFGVGWILVVAWIMSFRTRTGRLPWAAIASWLIAVVVVFVALDQTRIATLVLWTATAWIAMTELRGRDDDPQLWCLLAVTALVAAVVPPLVVWNGGIYIASIFDWFKTW